MPQCVGSFGLCKAFGPIRVAKYFAKRHLQEHWVSGGFAAITEMVAAHQADRERWWWTGGLRCITVSSF